VSAGLGDQGAGLLTFAAGMINDRAASLEALASDISRHDARSVAALLQPYVEWLSGPLDPAHAKGAVDAAVLVSRALYPNARAAECLPLARALLAGCEGAGDRAQLRRAAVLCGLLATETADLVGALEYHVLGLRLAAADEDRVEMARSWNTIGHAFAVSGRLELAARSYRRCIALLEPIAGASHVRYAALTNLAESCYHLGDPAEGLAFAGAALVEQAALPRVETHDAVLLRRTLVRLLIALDRIDEAAEHVEIAITVAQNAPSPRTAIVIDLTRAALEIVTGAGDVALSRLDRTLVRAREVPATLHEALATAVRAEESAGNAARALVRLEELFDHVYRHAVDRTQAVLAPAGVGPDEPADDHRRVEERARLVSKLEPAAAPRTWPALRRLAASAVLRMDDTGWHGVRVGALVKALALASGTSPLQALELGLAAEVHDIGMSSIPAAILAKKGRLNDSERAIVRRHPEAAAAMLADDGHPRILLARDMARFHHARWDGHGWPERVAGSSIPMGARLCAIADAYDAMVTGYASGGRLSMVEALDELQAEAGRQFDPGLVSCFDSLIRGELEGLGIDAAAGPGLEDFQQLVASLKDDRGFV
jgi:putative two-component system response regulator